MPTITLLQPHPNSYAVHWIAFDNLKKSASALGNVVRVIPSQKCFACGERFHAGTRERYACSGKCYRRLRRAFLRYHTGASARPADIRPGIRLAQLEHWLDFTRGQSRRHCEECGHVFHPVRSDARFCGATCRQRAHRAGKGAA